MAHGLLMRFPTSMVSIRNPQQSPPHNFRPPELYREKANVARNSIDPKMDYNAGINPAGSGFRVAQAFRHRELSQRGTLLTGAVALVKKFVSARCRNQQAGRLCYPELANSAHHNFLASEGLNFVSGLATCFFLCFLVMIVWIDSGVLRCYSRELPPPAQQSAPLANDRTDSIPTYLE